MKGTAHNGQFGKMAGLVLNSSSVLRLDYSAKLNICASISATSPSYRNVGGNSKRRQMNQEKTISKKELIDFYEPLLKGYSESYKTKIKPLDKLTGIIFKDTNEVSIEQLNELCSSSSDIYTKSFIERLIAVREIIYCRDHSLDLKILDVWRLISYSIKVIPSEFTISSIGSQGFLSIPLYKKDNTLE